MVAPRQRMRCGVTCSPVAYGAVTAPRSRHVCVVCCNPCNACNLASESCWGRFFCTHQRAGNVAGRRAAGIACMQHIMHHTDPAPLWELDRLLKQHGRNTHRLSPQGRLITHLQTLKMLQKEQTRSVCQLTARATVQLSRRGPK